MKRCLTMLLVLCLVLGLLACSAGSKEPGPKLVVEGAYSDELYQALKADWDAYNALSELDRMASSHLPGHCYREFGDWAEVEAFVGLELPNPLEELETLEKGNWAAAPLGFNGAERFHVSWYGTADGHVQGVQIDSGYRRGELRVGVYAAVYSDPAESKSPEKGWSVEHERLRYLEAREAGEPVITADSGEKYEAIQGMLARGHALYTVRVMGKLGTAEEIDALLEELLPYFEELPD